MKNSCGFHELHSCAEYDLDVNGLDAWVGSGFSMLSVDDITVGWDSEYTDNTFGTSFGAGFKVPMGNMTFGVDYAFRTVNATGLENNSVLAFTIGF